LITYEGEEEQDSLAPSISSSSCYLDEISLEEDSLEEGDSPKGTPLRTMASTYMEATKKDELPQEWFRFIYRDEDDWIGMK